MLNAWFIEKSEKWDLNNYSEQYKLFLKNFENVHWSKKSYKKYLKFNCKTKKYLLFSKINIKFRYFIFIKLFSRLNYESKNFFFNIWKMNHVKWILIGRSHRFVKYTWKRKWTIKRRNAFKKELKANRQHNRYVSSVFIRSKLLNGLKYDLVIMQPESSRISEKSLPSWLPISYDIHICI